MRSIQEPVLAPRAALVVLIAMSLVACGSSADPSVSPAAPASITDASGWQAADLLAVVTGDNVNALVGIDVASQTVTRLTVIEPNEAEPDMMGVVVSVPPMSLVLADSTLPNPLLWTWGARPGFAVREVDLGAARINELDVQADGALPFLYEGKLAWVSARPGALRSRITSTDAALDIELPGVAQAIVEGPGVGQISAAVILPDNTDRVVVVDVGTRKVTELPTPRVGLGHRGTVGGGTLWADDDTLVASAFSRKEPTIDDPENGEPDKTLSLLTWSVDASGSNADAVAGLVAGPTLGTTEFYATNVTMADERIAVVTGNFDAPFVEAIEIRSGEPAWKVDLVKAEFISGMTTWGTTLVVLQSRHVTFVDIESADRTTVELDGVTATSWVGR